MTARFIGIFAGCVFLFAAIDSVRTGYFLLKTGHRITRAADPLGYWGAVVAIAVLGVLAIVQSIGYNT